MIEILELRGEGTSGARSDDATQVLEAGGVVIVPDRPFIVAEPERSLLDPAISDGRSKNVSLDPTTGELSGVRLGDERRKALSAMIARFAQAADALLAELTPSYGGALQRRRTSFRPGAIAGRALSRRKDDRRLHVDAFPANPLQGRRILRVFANINPQGESRVWNVGEEDFETTVGRFRRRLTARGRGAGLKASLGLTKGRQSTYDQMMLQLHDAAKLDDAYQASAPLRRLEFAAGTLWIVYTDSVMHAALAGQHALEQTYLMPVEAMQRPDRSPLRVLERLTQRRLV